MITKEQIVKNWLYNRDALINHLLSLDINNQKLYLNTFWVSNEEIINLIIKEIWKK